MPAQLKDKLKGPAAVAGNEEEQPNSAADFKDPGVSMGQGPTAASQLSFV
jgi:hypothetical protein